MRFRLLSLPIITIALGAIWLSVGRYLTLLVDRLITLRVASEPVDRLEYDGGGFLIGKPLSSLYTAELSMTFGSTDNLNFDLCLCSDVSNMVVLRSEGRSFTLGPRTNPVDPSGRPEIYLVPESGDKVSFTVTRSVLSWPTPFEIDFMIRTPWWKRYVYYRLLWRKRSGAKLAMFWRYEQDYFTGSGWTNPAMMWNYQTGLLRVDIHPQASMISEAARPSRQVNRSYTKSHCRF
jgi:hypothetical protein